MHGPGDERGFHQPEGGTPSTGGAAEESWFHFGDESGATTGAADATERPQHRPATPEAVPARTPRHADETRHEPFVVSATPGGVDPRFMQAAESVTFSVGRSGGVKGLLTAVLVAGLLAGGGLLLWQGPRLAAAFSQEGDSAWHDDLDSAMVEANASNRPVLVHFTADWCPPCRTMKKHVFSAESVQQRIERDFVLVRIDLSDRMGPNTIIAQQCGVTSIPAIHVFSPDGFEIGSFGFAGSVLEFNAQLDRLSRR